MSSFESSASDVQSALLNHPYTISTRISVARRYKGLGYPDLAAGEAYLALLLIDEFEDENGEWHENVVDAISDEIEMTFKADVLRQLEKDTYRILVSCLLSCDNLQSADEICQRGLDKYAGDGELLRLHDMIVRKVGEDIPMGDYPNRGLARRELYAWNTFEPDRCSQTCVEHLNDIMKRVAPKFEVRITELDDLASNGKRESLPKVKQLGVFAKEDLQPGELVLDELSFLTATGRINDSYCDACSGLLNSSRTQELVACEECREAVFCSDRCASKAPSSYHSAICDADISSLAKDVPANEAADALYFLLVARAITMAETRQCHPLELDEVKYLWGDFNMPSPQKRGLPFSFKYHVLLPLHLLENLDVNPFTTKNYNTWVINTLFAKFRGVASARQSLDGSGRPEVGAVHPLWCLANHSCDPNVKWSWEGGMKFWVRTKEDRAVWDPPKQGDGTEWDGIKEGEEILSHYCDIGLPAKERREWAAGALGGVCRCKRCIWEAGEN